MADKHTGEALLEQPAKLARIAGHVIAGKGFNEAARLEHVAPASLRQARIKTGFDSWVVDKLELVVTDLLNTYHEALLAGQVKKDTLIVNAGIAMDKLAALKSPDHIRQAQPQTGPSVTDILAELKALPGTCQAVQINVYQGQTGTAKTVNADTCQHVTISPEQGKPGEGVDS